MHDDVGFMATGGEIEVQGVELDMEAVELDRASLPEKVVNHAEFFTLLSQAFHCFVDASSAGYAAVLFCVL